MILRKGKKAYSILYNLCPKCQDGKFWPSKNPYRNVFIKNIESCAKCKLKYEMEPGFWFGAMYFNYAFSVIIMLSLWIATYLLLPEIDIMIQIYIISSGIIILSPVNYFFSRLCWINLFVKYEKNKNQLDML